MPIATRTDILRRIAQGKGALVPYYGAAAVSSTAGAANSGSYTCNVLVNSVGTTYPTALQTLPLVNSTDPARLVYNSFSYNNSADETSWLCLFYRIGSLALNATGQQLTRDSWTAPLLRTRFGAASQALSLPAIILFTAAASATAPAFRLRNAGGTAGYVDQSGNTTAGSTTWTAPSATTASGSVFFLRLDTGDTSFRDIQNINVDTASGGSCAATIWLVEPLAYWSFSTHVLPHSADYFFAQGYAPSITPAATTSGTCTTMLGHLCLTNSQTSLATGFSLVASNE